MKITDRDKKLLLIIALALIATLYYQFVYVPQSTKLAELTQKKNDVEMQLVNNQAKVAKIKTLNKTLEDEKKKILKIAQKYLVKVKQEDIILMINKFESDSNIRINQIAFEDPKELGITLEQTTNPDGTVADPNAPTTTNSNGQQNQANAEANNQANNGTTTNVNQQTAPDLSNIELTDANINFKGTYSDLANLVKMVDENSKNIVSNELTINSKNVENQKDYLFLRSIDRIDNSEEFIEGTLNLKFFRISSIEKYVPVEESPLKGPLVRRTTMKTPINSYNWAAISKIYFDARTGEVVGTITRNEYGEFDENGSSSIPSSPKSNKTIEPTKVDPTPAPVAQAPKKVEEEVPIKPLVEYTTPIELARFDNISDYSGRSENTGDSISIGMDEVSSRNYKIVRSSVNFAQNSPLENMVVFDMLKKDIKLNEKPESLQLNIYTANPNEYEVGLVFSDNEGKKYIPFNKKLSFSGWEKIELKPNTVMFPAILEGIYFRRTSQDSPLSSDIYIDNLSSVYVQQR